MGELLARIWKAPASTAAGMVLAGLAALTASWAQAPEWVTIGAAVLMAVLGAFSNKGAAEKKGRLPVWILLLCAVSLALPSCTQYADGTVETDPEAVRAYTELAKTLLQDK